MQEPTEYVSTDGPTRDVFSPESLDVEILENGRSIDDFIDDKIKELGSKDSDEPFHVLNVDSLYMRHLRWTANLPRVQPFYAVKCNNTPTVLKTLSALGTGFDCASKGEIQLALSLGVTPDKIIYANSVKPLSHIRYACTHGVNMMTFDNEEELMKISLVHAKAKLVLRIAVDDSKSQIRLNSKFGAELEIVGRLLESARELGLEVIGVSFHVGSGCTDSLAFKQAIEDARHAFDTANSLGLQMSLLDIGGGYSGKDNYQMKFEELSEVINAALDEFFPPDFGMMVIAEPGRYFVESSLTMAVKVIGKKVASDDMDEERDGEGNSPCRKMMYYLNDGVYGSMNNIITDIPFGEVEIRLHRAAESGSQRYRTTIWGPTCDSLDRICERTHLPEVSVGDWMLLDNMGAYSVCLSTGFNGFEKTPIYTVVTAEAWNDFLLHQADDIISS